jgi:hypothetical protein
MGGGGGGGRGGGGGGGLICSGQDFGGHGEAANQAPHKIEGRLIVAQYGEPMI